MSKNNLKRENLAALMNKLDQAAKYASSTGDIPKDPDEVPVQNISTTDLKSPTGTENPAKANLAPNQTTANQPSEVSPKDGGTGLEEAEKQIVNQASEITSSLNKLTEAKVEASKTASNGSNIMDNISISYDIMAKVAHALTETEQGRIALQRAIDAEKGKQVFNATMEEIKYAAEQVSSFEKLASQINQENQMIKTATLKILGEIAKLPPQEQQEQLKIASEVYRANTLHQAMLDALGDDTLKYAYAQGAQDAQAINDTGAPVPPDAAGSVGSDLEIFLAALNQMVSSGEISPDQANMLSQLAQQAAMSDGAPDLSPEEAQTMLMNAAQQGVVDPKLAEAILASIMGGGVPPADVPPVPAGQPPMDPQAMASQNVAEPVQKQASVNNNVLDIARLSAAFAKKAYMKKMASADVLEEVELDPKDVIQEIVLAVDSGELDPDTAEKLLELLVAYDQASNEA